jgi:hypothetical protein
MKLCKRCAELIQDDAKACRFCNADQSTGKLPPPPKNSLQSCGGCIGWCVIGLLVLYVIGSLQH